MGITKSGALVSKIGRHFGNLKEAKRVLPSREESARTVSDLLFSPNSTLIASFQNYFGWILSFKIHWTPKSICRILLLLYRHLILTPLTTVLR